jgi:hypothetical protein
MEIVTMAAKVVCPEQFNKIKLMLTSRAVPPPYQPPPYQFDLQVGTYAA